MQAAQAGDCVFPGLQMQVIGVGNDDLEPNIDKCLWLKRLDGGASSDTDERWCAYRSMRCLKRARSGKRVRIAILNIKCKAATHVDTFTST